MDEPGRIAQQAQGKTLFDYALPTLERLRDTPQIRFKDGDGWSEWSWGEVSDMSARIASALRRLGVARGERVALMMRNRAEFYPCDGGALLAGATPFSIYNSSSPEQIAYVAGHSEATIAIVEDASFLQRFLDAGVDSVRQLIVIEDPEGVGDGVLRLSDLLGDDPIDVAAAAAEIKPEDLATLVYTSGTTGPPKGAMISHAGIAWILESLQERAAGLWHDAVYLSYLPLAHILERFAGYYIGSWEGGTVVPCPDTAQLAEYLGETKPEIFVGVPRVWEKIYGRLQSVLQTQAPEQRAQFEEAIAVGRKVVEHQVAGREIPPDLAAKHEEAEVILGLVRSLIGLDRARYCATGAAPTPPELLWFFLSLGIRLVEGYGMTESTFLISLDPVEHRPGTVGRPIPGQEVKIAGDGEILVRGGNVIPGYLKDPEKTAEAIDADGWLHTGDIGSVDEDGYLHILDRKKELIITAGGKNISPANIEAALKSFPIISQACVIGDDRKYLSALLTLDQDVLPGWAQANGVEGEPAALSQDPTVLAEVERCVQEANSHFSSVEQIKRFTVLTSDWDPDSEELTPTMKLKRRVIHAKYADQIDAMY